MPADTPQKNTHTNTTTATSAATDNTPHASSTTHHRHHAISAQFLPTLINALLHTAPNPEALLSLILATDFRTHATPPLHTVKLSYHQRKTFDFLLRTTLFISTSPAPSPPSCSSTAAATTPTHSNTTTDIQQLVITEEDRQLLARLFLLTFIHCPTAPLSFKYLAYETPEQLIRLFHLLNHTAPILRQQLQQHHQQHHKTTRAFALTIAYHLLHAVYSYSSAAADAATTTTASATKSTTTPSGDGDSAKTATPSTVTRVWVVNLRTLPTDTRLILDHLTYSAAKLWNTANYALKHQQTDLRTLKATFKATFWYKNLHSQSAQAVLEKLTVAWSNYLRKKTEKPPRFQPKNGHFPVKWKKQGFKILPAPHTRRWRFRLSLSHQTKRYLQQQHHLESRFLWVSLPKTIPLKVLLGLQEVEIVPHDIWGHRFYVLHLIYRLPLHKHQRHQKRHHQHRSVLTKPTSQNDAEHNHRSPSGTKTPQTITAKALTTTTTTSTRVMAIDLGITNFATVVIEDCRTPLIFDGKALVSRLRWAAKTITKLQTRFDTLVQQYQAKMKKKLAKKERYTLFSGLRKRITKIIWQTRWFVWDYLHKLSTWLVDTAVHLNVHTIAIGALPRHITQMNAVRRVNERLHRIPFGRFVRLLTYKAAMHGIAVHTVNEAYTSQTCSRCGYRARANRRQRGWFHCQKCNFQLNADVNAARNILWRVIPASRHKLPENGDSGLGYPWRVSVWKDFQPESLSRHTRAYA